MYFYLHLVAPSDKTDSVNPRCNGGDDRHLDGSESAGDEPDRETLPNAPA